ncbi:hypothetical protein BJ508DRAFT_332476 [Ascobolus immersus RN42]|uniref:Uncharacterized protein n=1 Tax=Ascobolus immersus RN42 TaxID=1160509 RepID=A0A3N4HMQ9_ASCIM|nr:hypothetical protein BJ508DRAFT_332476 [Ascobolus immersus RN42]
MRIQVSFEKLLPLGLLALQFIILPTAAAALQPAPASTPTKTSFVPSPLGKRQPFLSYLGKILNANVRKIAAQLKEKKAQAEREAKSDSSSSTYPDGEKPYRNITSFQIPHDTWPLNECKHNCHPRWEVHCQTDSTSPLITEAQGVLQNLNVRYEYCIDLRTEEELMRNLRCKPFYKHYSGGAEGAICLPKEHFPRDSNNGGGYPADWPIALTCSTVQRMLSVVFNSCADQTLGRVEGELWMYHHLENDKGEREGEWNTYRLALRGKRPFEPIDGKSG